jgi:hypothetical protein
MVEAVADDEDDDRNNRRVGDDRWCGDTLPPSLSLDVDEGGVGGSEKPTEGKNTIAPSKYVQYNV